MIMEPWNDLDVDDSDLRFLLRPCNRNQSSHNLSTPTLHSQPFVLPSSQSTPKTLPPSPLPVASSSQSRRQAIPGPAGAVQAAMIHKTRDNHNFSRPEDNPVCTQEYIRRAVEDSHEDDAFKSDPWLCALAFVYPRGGVDAADNYIPLNSMNKCLRDGRVDQVVAIVKSCMPNGLGDMMVTLKDPTGTVCATVHHKVFAEKEFAKAISVGSVLILQKVSVFSPSRSVHYLNITPKNIVKIFSTDAEVQLEQSCLLPTQKHVSCETGSLSKCSDRSETLQLVVEARTDKIMAAMRQNKIVRSSLQEDCLMEKRDSIPNGSMLHIPTCRKQNASLVEEILLDQEDEDNTCNKDAVIVNSPGDYLESSNNNDELANNVTVSSKLEPSAGMNILKRNNGPASKSADGCEKPRQPLATNPSLLQWTDEQLSELFSNECEDNDLFS